MDARQLEHRLVVTNQLAELLSINNFLDDLSVQWGLPESVIMTLHLVVEEAFTNVVQYAYKDDCIHQIELNVSKKDETLHLVIQDDGYAYDPTEKKDPNTLLSVEDREIGGLGIFLIKQLMDRVSYDRVDGKNRLTMEKNL